MSRKLCAGLVWVLFFPLINSTLLAQPTAKRPIELSVDASEAPRKLLHARLSIPVSVGPLTLYYPKWIQGEHSPNGPILDLSGLKLRAGGKAITWRRDDVDLFAFHCVIPPGADVLEVALDYLGATSKEGGSFGAAPCMTANLAVMNWHTVLLYPKGTPVRDLPIRADITLPAGWKLGTALPIDGVKGERTQFQTVSLEMLVDSPVVCGKYFKDVPLGPKDGPPHYLELGCDSAAGLALTPELQKNYERLVAEAGALFGARHYRSYRFLVAMSDHISHTGIEHHESSDNRVPERFLLEENNRKTWTAWLLAHEYVHSWNGKYRRPEGLATADYQVPMRTDLLWVYEGLTQYLGFVLAARSGLYTPELSQENYALIADWARNQRGRGWRPLEDTAVAAPHLYFATSAWGSRRRGVDFYDEGALLWLDVDTLIREKSGGKKSLDDFCRAFFGGKSGPPEVKAYSFPDIVQTLNGVMPNDWKSFFERRLKVTDAEDPPLAGLARSGWKVVYKDKAGDMFKARDTEEKGINLTASIGLAMSEEGKVIDVIPGKAADKAGVGPGMKVIGVNDRRFSAERLHDALEATAKGGQKIRLLLENNETFKTVTLDYSGGEKYPHLERIEGKADLLSEIFRPRTLTKAKR